MSVAIELPCAFDNPGDNEDNAKAVYRTTGTGLDLQVVLYYCSHYRRDSRFGLIVSGYFWFGLFVRYCSVLILAAVVDFVELSQNVSLMQSSHYLYGLIVSTQHLERQIQGSCVYTNHWHCNKIKTRQML